MTGEGRRAFERRIWVEESLRALKGDAAVGTKGGTGGGSGGGGSEMSSSVEEVVNVAKVGSTRKASQESVTARDGGVAVDHHRRSKKAKN